MMGSCQRQVAFFSAEIDEIQQKLLKITFFLFHKIEPKPISQGNGKQRCYLEWP